MYNNTVKQNLDCSYVELNQQGINLLLTHTYSRNSIVILNIEQKKIAGYSNCKSLGFNPTTFSFYRRIIIVKLRQQFIFGRINKLY